MKRLLLICICMVAAICAHAYDIEEGGVYYNLDNENETASVAKGSKTYSGNVFIPSVILSDGKTYTVTSISDGAFYNCTNLTEITIPNSVTSIGDYAFWLCSGLKEITIPNSVTSIGNSAFESCSSLTEITLPSSLISIGNSAFNSCSSLTEITLPSSLISIGYYAFNGCSGLKEITIPNSVTSIGDNAFNGCSGLTEITIPNSVTSIGKLAFRYCSNLSHITVDKDNPNYSSVDGILLSKDKKTLVAFPEGKANDRFTLLPPSITAVGDYAFYNCSSLKNVIIPNKLTKIGERAFNGCNNLNTITFLCDKMIDPDDIKNNSFDGLKFGNINIYVRKELVEEYKETAFYNIFASINTSFMQDDNEYIAVSDNTVELLSTTSSDHTFVLPETVTYKKTEEETGTTYSVGLIGDYAFEKATSYMKEVVVPKGVAYIGAKAFRNDAGTIERIFLLNTNPGTETLSTLRFELDENANGEFADGQKIYVKKSVYDKYLTEWAKYADKIDYKIQDISIKNKYGTFAREFDTYLGDAGESVLAFVGGKYHKGNGTEYYVHMESIQAAGYDGLYIPKNTGVVLKAMNADETPADYYYCIGEKDDATYNVTDNAMKGVTVNDAEINGYDKWVIQQGEFRALNGQTAPMPVHKAYLQLEGVSAEAKIVFGFDDDSVTGISGIDAPSEEDAVYYNLNGMRVSMPAKGVYIRNGKKVVIK